MFDLEGIKYLFISGKVAPKKRAKILKEFRESKEPLVLVVSGVAQSGLNIDCANIVILKVRQMFLACS